MAPQATKAVEEANIQAAAQNTMREDIASLAYQLWQDRGCPVGSPDEDWYRAEEMVRDRHPSV